ncbi:MAG: 16S rRNA (cytidine1402-2'-O)-methyltransferase [Paracoccaceae bacterium]|jgi:16S rRNA (cytidine1402-2'-O)-methyltransferase
MSVIANSSSPARPTTLEPALYFVSTPIGSARDITLRALDILLCADVIAAEDTRTARKLMEIHGVAVGDRQLIAYHDHNGAAQRPRILRHLAEGRSVAYVSEAGTPLVADPGFQLGVSVLEAGFLVLSAPGASAVLAALTVSGLPTDRFMFVGFSPQTGGARQTWVTDLSTVQATLIIYESPKRVHKFLGILGETFGGDRPVALCRELTKRFEEVIRGSISDVQAAIADRSLKGEIVLVVGGASEQVASIEDMEDALRDRLRTLSVKDATAEVAALLGLPKRQVYQAALALSDLE